MATRADHRHAIRAAALSLGCLLAACTTPRTPEESKPDVAPHSATQVAPTLPLDGAQIVPMYRELLAIDLPTVAKVAAAQNLDIRAARERLEAARGQYESTIEGLFPVIAPGIAAEKLTGVNRAVTGELVPANFTSVQPALLIQVLLNPGRIIFDVIAAKKRVAGAEQTSRFVRMDKLRQAAVQYYDLVLAQSRLGAAREAVAEAEELARITASRLRTGTGLVADQARAAAALSARQQDLASALNAFYAASVTLAVTLDVDPTITLVPKADHLAATALVRDDLTIDEMLTTVLYWRPDLKGARAFAAAATADRNAVLWGALSPQLQASYQYGKPSGDVQGREFGPAEQQRKFASAQMNLSLAALGRTRTARAGERQAQLDLEGRLENAKAEVVRFSQDSLADLKLIDAAQRQVDAAVEAHRLTQVGLKAGTALTLDVLTAQDALNDARERFAGAVVKYNQAQVNLLAALGLLDNINLGASPAEAG